MGSLVIYDLPPTPVGLPAGIYESGSARGCASRNERLSPHALGRPLPAQRPPPLLFQAHLVRRNLIDDSQRLPERHTGLVGPMSLGKPPRQPGIPRAAVIMRERQLFLSAE